MNAPIRDAFDCSSRKSMRRHFVSGFPRTLLSLGQEKSSGVEIDHNLAPSVIVFFYDASYASVLYNGSYARTQNAKCVYYVITDTFKFLNTKVTFFTNSAFAGGNIDADIIWVLIVLSKETTTRNRMK